MEDHAAAETSFETCGILIWLPQAMAYLDVFGNVITHMGSLFFVFFFLGGGCQIVRYFTLEN
jgi:hypothetical protein